jgi:hypothetical protein
MPLRSLRSTLAFAAASVAFALASDTVQAQHGGDIGLRIVGEQLEVYGPLGGADTEGVYLATFGDTGFPGFTSNPGFDAAPGTFSPGRLGFMVLAGLSRWDPIESEWLDPLEVGERLRISFITLETIVDDQPEEGFDLAVQPDGGWHRHVNFDLRPDDDGVRLAGVYRVDFAMYSTMGIGESDPFTILFDYEAPESEVTAAIESMYEDDCPGDLDGNGMVDGGDLATLLGEWGTEGTLGDLTEDGLVDGQDLSILLGSWGPCPD